MVDNVSVRQLCCAALTSLLGADKVFLPGSTGYNASLSSYFTPQASAVHPQCFVAPQTAADVSEAIKSLSYNTWCIFAIRSGGHTWFPGANNAPHGVTFDLRSLNSIELDANKSYVTVGIGATWDTVYAYLESHGLSVAGGRVAGVGVGGLTLGGGISYFGPRYGWTLNQAISFDIILANGSIVQANESRNFDLWRGLRGGSNNFGVVTSITLATFEQGPLWSTTTDNAISEVPNQAKIYSSLSLPGSYDENASFYFGWGISQPLGQTDPITVNVLVYTKPENNSNPGVYRDILSLPSLAPLNATISNMSKIAIEGAVFQPPQVQRYLTATTTFVLTEEMILAAFVAYNESVKSIQNLTGVSWSVIIEPLPPQLYARGNANNSLGLSDRNQSLAVCLVGPSWVDQAQDKQIFAAARSVMDAIEKRAKELGAYDPYIYLNYAAPWQNVIPSYGDTSVKRLQKLREEVDPRGIFTHQVPGGFKIPLE